MAVAGPSTSEVLQVVAALFVLVCRASGFQTGDDVKVKLESRQGLEGLASPSVQPLWAQLLQNQNSRVFPGQQQSLNTLGLGLGSQGLPFSSLQNTLGGQAFGTPLQSFGNQGLLGTPFSSLGAGLGGSQLLGNPGLLGMLPTVNRLGMLGATSQLGGGQLGILPGTLGLQSLHPLLAQAQARQDNLGHLLRLASLLSDEQGALRHPSTTPNTSLQLTGSFRHRPQHPHHHPHPLHRLLSLPTDTHQRANEILDGRNTAGGFTNRANLGNHVSRSGTPQSTGFNRPPLPLPHTSHPPRLPLPTATHRPTHNDGFRFPSEQRSFEKSSL